MSIGRLDLVLISSCLFDTMMCYDNVFRGPSGPDLLKKAYDQACADVEARYPSILEEVLNSSRQEILNVERDKIASDTIQAQNLIRSKFDAWKQ